MKILRTNTLHTQFLQLENMLDAELEHEFPKQMHYYQRFNKFKTPIKAVVLLSNSMPVACGAIKELNDQVEIKRMFVRPAFRSQGLSKIILTELETWASTLGYTRAILETGSTLKKAINLYSSFGYSRIPNFGPYIGMETSICFEKTLH